MLNITLHGNILQVEEVIMSFTDTLRQVWSYDFEHGVQWEGVYNGEQKHKIILTEGKVLWAGKHWLSKVNATLYQRQYRLCGEVGKRRAYVKKCDVWQRIGLNEFEQIQLNSLVFETHNTAKHKFFTEYMLYVKQKA